MRWVACGMAIGVAVASGALFVDATVAAARDAERSPGPSTPPHPAQPCPSLDAAGRPNRPPVHSHHRKRR